MTGGRRIADDRRKGTGCAANDDVLRRRALEPYRIDHDVEEDREGQQRASQEIGDEAQSPDREAGEDEAERQRLAGREIRPFGIGRLLVRRITASISEIVPHVERAGRARADRDAQQRRKSDDEIDRMRREQNSGERRDDHKLHHARLDERQIIAAARRWKSPRARMRRYRR